MKKLRHCHPMYTKVTKLYYRKLLLTSIKFTRSYARNVHVSLVFTQCIVVYGSVLLHVSFNNDVSCISLKLYITYLLILLSLCTVCVPAIFDNNE